VRWFLFVLLIAGTGVGARALWWWFNLPPEKIEPFSPRLAHERRKEQMQERIVQAHRDVRRLTIKAQRDIEDAELKAQGFKVFRWGPIQIGY